MKLKKIVNSVSVLLACGMMQCISAHETLDTVKQSVDANTKISVDVEYYDLILKNAVLKEEKIKLDYEIKNLKQENEDLKKEVEKYKKRSRILKKKLDEKQDYVSPEQVKNEVEVVRAEMLLQFNNQLGEYIKENPRKKISPLDMSRLFSDFLTFNINYTNNGDSILSPLSPTVNAKGTIAGAAITS